jgi:hypothetical protein
MSLVFTVVCPGVAKRVGTELGTVRGPCDSPWRAGLKGLERAFAARVDDRRTSMHPPLFRGDFASSPCLRDQDSPKYHLSNRCRTRSVLTALQHSGIAAGGTLAPFIVQPQICQYECNRLHGPATGQSSLPGYPYLNRIPIYALGRYALQRHVVAV